MKKLHFQDPDLLIALSLVLACLCIGAALLYVRDTSSSGVADVRADLCTRFAFLRNGVYINDEYGFRLVTPAEYCWFESYSTAVSFSLSDGTRSSFELRIYPFSMAEEEAYVRTQSTGPLASTDITIDGVRGLRLTGEKIDYVLLPIAAGTMRISTALSAPEANHLLSLIRFDRRPDHAFEWQWATYRDDTYGFQLRYPTNLSGLEGGAPQLRPCPFPPSDSVVCVSFGPATWDHLFSLSIDPPAEHDPSYQERLTDGKFSYVSIQGKSFVRMFLHNGIDGPGTQVVYIPNEERWADILTPVGEVLDPKTRERIVAKILETLSYPPALTGNNIN